MDSRQGDGYKRCAPDQCSGAGARVTLIKRKSANALHGVGQGERNENMVSKKDREAAWNRASKIRGKNPETWRRDELGNPMRHGSYGTDGEFGWEIDHRNPQSKGGTDHGRNLRALNTDANREKRDKV